MTTRIFRNWGVDAEERKRDCADNDISDGLGKCVWSLIMLVYELLVGLYRYSSCGHQ